MDPKGTSTFRAAIVARARFVEDLVIEQAAQGARQYVILGAGLDTFAQRHPDVAARLRIFEIDQPGTQAWKRRRLQELGFGVPDWLRFVPVNFEQGGSWWSELGRAGFDPSLKTVVASTGVTPYITKEATAQTLRQISTLGAGSHLAISFLVNIDLLPDHEQQALRWAEAGARNSGTPFISFYSPAEMVELALECGFSRARHITPEELADRYFEGRTDGLQASVGEQLVVAST